VSDTIGRSIRRADGEAKVTGAATYCIDREEPRMLHAKLLRSPVAAGRITKLETAAARALPGVRAIVTAADAPGRSGMFIKDQPLLADEVVRYIGEPVAAIAADTPEAASAAAAAIVLEIEPSPAVTEIEAAVADGAPLVHPAWETYGAEIEGTRDGNRLWEAELVSGDVAAGFARPDVVVLEDEFRVPRQHQSYIEPRCAVARYETGRYTVHSSTQFPALVRDRTAEALGVRASAVRIFADTVGGGFGGKLDAGPEPYAALLARHARRPVKLVYTRGEEFVAGTMRENATVRLRSAVTRDGDVLAQEAEWLMDAGAYAGETPAIAGIATLTVAGAYRVGAARYRGHAVYTNTPPTGSFRGVCGPYMVFATERHMDNIAAELGIDRRALRMRNAYRPGDRMPNGQELHDTAFADAFERIEEIAPWEEVSAPRPYHGVGIVAVTWLTNPLAGSATLKLNEDGTVGLVTAATDIGSGAVAMGLVQIVAAELGVSPEDVVLHAPDTDAAPYDAGAQGSRTVYNVGNAIIRAAGEVRRQVFERAAGLFEAAEDDLRLVDGHVEVAGAPQRRIPLRDVALAALAEGGPIAATGSAVSAPAPIDEATMRGAYFRHFNAPTFHVHLAEVQIDPDTGRVQILRYVVAQDVGRAVNPAGIEGQIHGGVAQGIGYALFENIRLADGRVLESDLEAYRLPGALDVPRIEAILLEHPDPAGPYGAKGAGEPPIVPVAAAIANAVSDAIGRPIDRLPITPFDVLAALRGEGRSVTEEGHRRVVRSAG
jgi:CO/xanthine dehydrogenase Mo-binding subunit